MSSVLTLKGNHQDLLEEIIKSMEKINSGIIPNYVNDLSEWRAGIDMFSSLHPNLNTLVLNLISHGYTKKINNRIYDYVYLTNGMCVCINQIINYLLQKITVKTLVVIQDCCRKEFPNYAQLPYTENLINSFTTSIIRLKAGVFENGVNQVLRGNYIDGTLFGGHSFYPKILELLNYEVSMLVLCAWIYNGFIEYVKIQQNRGIDDISLGTIECNSTFAQKLDSEVTYNQHVDLEFISTLLNQTDKIY